MTKKRKQDQKLMAVASVMEVIGKLTGDQSLRSEAATKREAAALASNASGKTPAPPK